jgi:hypothetical protein
MHQSGHVDERYLLAVMESLPAGTSELYCHPAERRPESLAPHQPGYEHAVELAALTSPRVRAAIDSGGIRLVAYPDL